MDDSPADQTDGLGDTLENVETGPEGGEAPKEGEEGAGDGEPKTEAEIAAAAAAADVEAAKSKPKEGEGDPNKPKVEPVKEPAKKPDPVNDPIPKELAKETQDRIRSLIKTTKETEAKATESTQQLDYIVNGVRATGMNPQQYGEVLSFMTLFNSGDPKQQETALGLVENIADRLAALLGKERTTSDPLKNFPDLVAAVAQGQMTRAWAGQMASARRQQATRSDIETTARTSQDAAAAAAQERETARVDMNKWETETAAKDPQFKLLAPKLVKELQKDFQNIPPKEWLPRFQQSYRIAKAAAGPVRSTTTGQFVKGGVPVNQPLRARSSAAGGAHAPKSVAEALDAALDSMK